MSDFDCVICPACSHQFPAIPVNVQDEIKRLRAVLERIAEGYPHGSLARDMARNVLKEPDNG